MEQQIYSVTQINTYIQSMMDSDRLLSGLCIRGEISNYKVYPSGHHYFSLKDATGALRCVMFKSSAIRLRFRPENGMKVLALGKISVFPRDGAYQLYCTNLTPDGVGDLHVAFEQLKAKLQAEGLFDASPKQPPPVQRSMTCCGSCASGILSPRSCYCPCGSRGWRLRRSCAAPFAM